MPGGLNAPPVANRPVAKGDKLQVGRVTTAETATSVKRVYPNGTVFEVLGPERDGVIRCKCPRLGLPILIPADAVWRWWTPQEELATA